MLSRALDRLDGVFVAPETHWFNAVQGQRLLLSAMPRSAAARAAAEAMIRREYPKGRHLFEAKRREIEAAISREGISFDGFRAMLEELSDAQWVAEKTPWHAAMAERILAADGDSKLLGIVRHPAATVASVIGKPGFRRVSTPLQCIARWSLINRRLVRAVDRLGPNRALMLRYEDLVREPEFELRKVSGFLGVSFGHAALEPGFSDSSHRARDTTGFASDRIDIWRETLQPEHARLVQALAKPLAARFGYADDGAAASWRERLAHEAEILLQSGGLASMRFGVFPHGAATDALLAKRREDPSEV